MPRDYSNEEDSLENLNADDKYSITGESEFSRESTIPFDQDEVLSVRHYSFGPLELHGRQRIRTRESRDESYPPSANNKHRYPDKYRLSDEELREDIVESLFRNTEVDSSYIEVIVKNGDVVLKGSVITNDEKIKAAVAVEHLAGVGRITNDLHIESSEEEKRRLGRYGLMNNITGMN